MTSTCCLNIFSPPRRLFNCSAAFQNWKFLMLNSFWRNSLESSDSPKSPKITKITKNHQNHQNYLNVFTAELFLEELFKKPPSFSTFQQRFKPCVCVLPGIDLCITIESFKTCVLHMVWKKIKKNERKIRSACTSDLSCTQGQLLFTRSPVSSSSDGASNILGFIVGAEWERLCENLRKVRWWSKNSWEGLRMLICEVSGVADNGTDLMSKPGQWLNAKHTSWVFSLSYGPSSLATSWLIQFSLKNWALTFLSKFPVSLKIHF